MKKGFILAAAALLLAGCGVYTGTDATTEAVTSAETTVAESQTGTDAVETTEEVTEESSETEEETTESIPDETEETTTEAEEFPEGVVGFKAGRTTEAAVTAINNGTFANSESHVYDIFNMSFSVAKVTEMINSYAFPSARYQYGKPLTDDIIAVLLNLRNLETLAIQTSIDVKYGILTREVDVRSFPSEIYLNDHEYLDSETDADYLQESSFFAGEAVAILHTSSDSKYYFAIGRDYYGWIKASDVLLCSKQAAYIFSNTDKFAIIKCAFIYADENEDVYLSMGTALPYVAETNSLLLPVNEEETGYLYLSGDSLIYSDTKVEGAENIPVKNVSTGAFTTHVGYMEFTEKNVETQAKELEGCSFSWGSKGLGYDCSAVCRSIYRCFGVVLPRNSSTIKYAGMKVTDLSSLSSSDKLTAIATLPKGTILLMPGHAMVYMGDGTILHSLVGYVENGVTHKNYSVVKTSLQVSTLSGDVLIDDITTAVSPSFS